MPKCYMNAIRGYRTRKYKENGEHDPHVMTTRSGLSIRKITAPKCLGVAIRSTPVPRQRTDHVTIKKYPIIKYKSLSYLSFVTRFIIALRVPELELAGVDPRETLEYLGDNGYFYRSESSSSYSGCDSFDDDDSESDLEEEVFEGVDDNGIFTFDDESQTSQEDSDAICESVSEISLGNSEKSENAKIIVQSNENLEAKCVGVSLSGNQDLEGKKSEQDGNTFIVQMQKESQLPFKCEECDKGFTLYSAYTAHVRSHAKQRNRCVICGKLFSRSWLLKGHMRTHTGERPFPCPAEGCDKAFADKSNLRSHMLIHSVTCKNFTCEKCGRAFAQKRYLHKHMLEVCRLI